MRCLLVQEEMHTGRAALCIKMVVVTVRCIDMGEGCVCVCVGGGG